MAAPFADGVVGPTDDPYVAQMPLIEAVLLGVCRARRLSHDDADEFRSWARVRLLDHDRSILRQFAGRSSLRTYLTVVLSRLYLDWRDHAWGKWRPSSEALRNGPLAVELERLVLRDHYTVLEATYLLVARGLASSAQACERLWDRLPQRRRRQRVDVELLTEQPDLLSTGPEERAGEERATAVLQALDDALSALSPDDRALLRLRYWTELSVPRIARLTGGSRSGVYRRLLRIHGELRRGLVTRGIAHAGAGSR